MNFNRTLKQGALEPVTLAEAKLHCRVDGSDDDALIVALIVAARQLCENVARLSVAQQVCTLKLDGFPAGEIRLPGGPVSSVTSVVYLDIAGQSQTLGAPSYQVDKDSNTARVLPAPGTSWPGTQSEAVNAVTVTYEAGWAQASVPQAVKQWVLLHVAHYHRHREAMSTDSLAALPLLDGLLDPWRVWAIN
jgi:uncharacterized phiE125 gp8 family phage protein